MRISGQQGTWPGASRGCLLGRVDLILHGHQRPSHPPGAWPSRQKHLTFSDGKEEEAFLKNPLENNARKWWLGKVMLEIRHGFWKIGMPMLFYLAVPPHLLLGCPPGFSYDNSSRQSLPPPPPHWLGWVSFCVQLLCILWIPCCII